MLSERGRIQLIGFIIVVLSTVIVGRLMYLQLYKHSLYEKEAKRQSFKELKFQGERGSIYTVDGALIAKEVFVASVFSYGMDGFERRKVNRLLRRYGVKRKVTSKRFTWLVRNISVDKAKKIVSISDKLHYVLSKHRFYPGFNTFGQIVGFTGVDNQGLYGIEAIYDSVLRGDSYLITFLKDSRNKLILWSDYPEEKRNPNYIKLTLESDIQKIMDNILSKDIKYFGASHGIALVMDINTGDIVGSISKPDFDPNMFSKYNRQSWKNYATQYTFEPGSIFKTVTFSYLLQTHKINLNSVIDCGNGKYKIHGHTYNDVHRYKRLKVSEILIHSSNVGTVKLIRNSDNKGFYDFITKAGFGNKIGVVGALEEKGIVRNYKKWSKLSKFSIAIGQEIYVTPIQIVRFYAAVANGGFLVKPTYVREIFNRGDLAEVKRERKKIVDRVVAKRVASLLRSVVEEGTGSNAKSDIVKIAGKTGTAQKFDKKKRHYSKEKYVASFAGFFPYDNPKYAMIVIYDSPKKSIYGGSTAAITFRRIAEQIMILEGRGFKIYRVSDESKKAA